MQFFLGQRTHRLEEQLRGLRVLVQRHLGHDRDDRRVVRVKELGIRLHRHLAILAVTEQRRGRELQLVDFVRLALERDSQTLVVAAGAAVALSRALDVHRAVGAARGFPLIRRHIRRGGLGVSRPAGRSRGVVRVVGALVVGARDRRDVDHDDIQVVVLGHGDLLTIDEEAELVAFDRDALAAATDAASEGLVHITQRLEEVAVSQRVAAAEKGHFTHVVLLSYRCRGRVPTAPVLSVR